MNVEPKDVIQRDLAGMLVPGKQYHSALPAPLIPWYCYTRDGGHSIYVVVEQLVPRRTDGSIDAGAGAGPVNIVDFAVPAPVKLVLRSPWHEEEGVIWATLPYSDEFGVLAAADDDEY